MHRSAWKYKLQVLWTVAKPGDVKVIKGLASILQTMLRKQDVVCAIFFIYVKQFGAFSPNTCSFKGLCPYGSYRFSGGLGQAGMNAGTNWVVLVSEL